ncbi:hypothetical protein [Niveispirillum sp.]|uniref:hypothetical protein n=1 Tax=Niveispirillum sp. TaxID=1917217 RepID=UPI0040352E06
MDQIIRLPKAAAIRIRPERTTGISSVGTAVNSIPGDRAGTLLFEVRNFIMVDTFDESRPAARNQALVLAEGAI